MDNLMNRINHQKRKMGKKQMTLLAMIVCCVAIIAVGSLAFFTAEETSYNVITTMKVDIELKEDAEGGLPWPEGGMFEVEPGMDITKVVYAENQGSIDVYVRMLLDKVIYAAPGSDAELNFDNITLDINTTDWIEKDGAYYYKHILKPGEQTVPLFTNVHFGTVLGNEYMNSRAEIKVTLQIVQSKNNSDSVLTAVGWPEA